MINNQSTQANSDQFFRAKDPLSGKLVPATYFAVLCHPRCGSTLLVHSLRDHPSIRIYGELFQDEEETRRKSFRGQYEYYETGEDGAPFLRSQIFCETNYAPIMAIGFKIFYQQARSKNAASAWSYLLEHRNIKILHLNREKSLDSYVSLCEAFATSHWHVAIQDKHPSPVTKIHLDPQDCLGYLNELYAYRNWAQTAFGAHSIMELSYEKDLCANFERTLNQVQRFLGVPEIPLQQHLRKQSTRPLSERVENYDEILKVLRNTIHEQAILENNL